MGYGLGERQAALATSRDQHRQRRVGALFTSAPYLLLGPIQARQYVGGGAWGMIAADYTSSAVVGGLGLVGRRPRRSRSASQQSA